MRISLFLPELLVVFGTDGLDAVLESKVLDHDLLQYLPVVLLLHLGDVDNILLDVGQPFTILQVRPGLR